MMLLNRHRIAKLIELADLERRLAGPERMLREEDVALLVKAAYDDASDAARAAFMARVQAMLATAWPWSAVQVNVCEAGSWPGRVGEWRWASRRRPQRPARPRSCSSAARSNRRTRSPAIVCPSAARPRPRCGSRCTGRSMPGTRRRSRDGSGRRGGSAPTALASGEPAQHAEGGAANGQSAGGAVRPAGVAARYPHPSHRPRRPSRGGAPP
jgi:hypothetical protein